MHLMFSIFHTEPKSWTGCLPPSNDERRGAWAQRYYSEGHHHLTNDELKEQDDALCDRLNQ